MFTAACHRSSSQYNQISHLFLLATRWPPVSILRPTVSYQNPVCYMLQPPHLFLVCIMLKISGLGCKSWNPTLCSSFHPPISPALVDTVPLSTSGVPRNFVWGRGVQQIQLRTEDRENGDLGVVAF